MIHKQYTARKKEDGKRKRVIFSAYMWVCGLLDSSANAALGPEPLYAGRKECQFKSVGTVGIPPPTLTTLWVTTPGLGQK